MGLPHEFVAYEGDLTWTMEQSVDGEAKPHLNMPPTHPWLTPRRGALWFVQSVIARGLRYSGITLMGSPLLVIPYAVTARLAPTIAAAIVVFFVCAAITFFACLNAFIVIALIRHALSRRLTVRLWTRDDEDVEEAAEALKLVDAPTVTGRVLAIGAPTDGTDPTSVMRSFVSRAQGVHHVAATDFAIEDDHGDLFVVRFENAPLFLGAPLSSDGSAAAREAHAAAQARLAKLGRVLPTTRGVSTSALRLGDRVEVRGHVASTLERTDHFELGGGIRSIGGAGAGQRDDDASAPYRRGPGASARLLRCDDEHAMIVRDRSDSA